VKNIVRLRVIEAAAYLSPDIEQIQMENPSFRASMVAMLLPWMYSIAAQNWPSISPAP